MEYFDFHTHAFVDTLAERAVGSLAVTSGIVPATDGTLSGLKKVMAKNRIGRAMILPVATKPSQQLHINNWAAEIMDGSIFCCGTVHPDAEDAEAEVERIASLGLRGLKFHSEYQHFRPDEERMMPVYRKAAELGLITVFHGGWDPLSGEDILAKPRCFARLAERIPGLTVVVAHMGGVEGVEETAEWLAGRFGNVYFDTGVVADYISDEEFCRLVEMQGADKVLFGSDCPWDHPEKEIAMIERLPLSAEDKELIFHKNAEKLLNIAAC